MDEEQIIKIQLMEREVNQMHQQLQLIEQNISELNELINSLDELEIGKEVLVDFGKKVFAHVKIIEDKLIINVGKGHLIKKNIPETKKIINDQLEKLKEAKNQIMNRLNDLQEEMNNIITEIQNEQRNITDDKKKKY